MSLNVLLKRSMDLMLGRKRPLVAVLGITSYCNYYCKMCPFGDPDKEKQLKYAKEHDLTLDGWKKVIDKISKECVWCIVEGGEPFSRSDIMDILEYMHGKIPVTVITNASLLHTIDLDRLRSLIMSICCSVDSVKKDSYCKVRGVKEELYYRVMNNVKLLSEKGINRYINSVITKWNTEEFITQEYFDYVRDELDIHDVSITFVQNMTNGPDLLPDRKTIEKVCESIIDYSKHKSDPYILMPRLYFEQILKYGRTIFDECKVWRSVVVDADGGVSPCWKFHDKVSILEYDIKDIWKMPFWEDVKDCKDCNMLACVWLTSQSNRILVNYYVRTLINHITRAI